MSQAVVEFVEMEKEKKKKKLEKKPLEEGQSYYPDAEKEKARVTKLFGMMEKRQGEVDACCAM